MATTETPPTPGVRVGTKGGYHHGDLRAQLVAAARGLVESHGPDGFSVAEAARLAGVSSAAPYKHFRDRDEILHAVVGEALDRLAADMRRRAGEHPRGSLEAVAAVGKAYVDFARTEPGVFRLSFGLVDVHGEDAALSRKGQDCFAVVVEAAAARLGLPPDDPDVRRRAYILWSFVHGHSFLTIDGKAKVVLGEVEEWAYLMDVGRGVLARGPGPDDAPPPG